MASWQREKWEGETEKERLFLLFHLAPRMYLPHKQKHKRIIECLKFARDFCDIPGKEYRRKSQCMQNIII